MRLISVLSAPHRKRPFCCPLEVSVFVCMCVYVVNMPDGRYQAVKGGCTGYGLHRHFIHSALQIATEIGGNLIQKNHVPTQGFRKYNMDFRYSLNVYAFAYE